MKKRLILSFYLNYIFDTELDDTFLVYIEIKALFKDIKLILK